MPGFTIHIAVAKQYIKKHPLQIKNEEEFINGTIAPDLNTDMTQISTNKHKTHYEQGEANRINISSFLNDSKVDIKQDYWKGYLIHLIVDDYFYNKKFKEETTEMLKNKDSFYYDYDCLNKTLLQYYKIEPLEQTKKYMNILQGKPKYLELERIKKFIEEISNINIEEHIEKYGGENYEYKN